MDMKKPKGRKQINDVLKPTAVKLRESGLKKKRPKTLSQYILGLKWVEGKTQWPRKTKYEITQPPQGINPC